MDPIAHCAETVLRRHPAPAVRLTELLELVRDEGPHRTLAGAELRRRLELHPETFRFLDPWRGPWRHTRDSLPAELGPSEPWVVVVADPGAPAESRSATLSRLRESVRWVVREADPRSRREVSRAHEIVLREREARGALKRAA